MSDLVAEGEPLAEIGDDFLVTLEERNQFAEIASVDQ
jgi:hypothetical protein